MKYENRMVACVMLYIPITPMCFSSPGMQSISPDYEADAPVDSDKTRALSTGTLTSSGPRQHDCTSQLEQQCVNCILQLLDVAHVTQGKTTKDSLSETTLYDMICDIYVHSKADW